MPVNKTVKVGVWENGEYVGVVIFSPGASAYAGRRYGLNKQQVCELTRVALTAHRTPVSRILSIALKKLRAANPGLRLVMSYADPSEGHHGGVYQAGGWLYSGLSEPGGDLEYLVDGKWTHGRSVHAKYGFKGKALIQKTGLKTRKPSQKHRYLLPLDDEMRRQIEPLRKPYPKRAGSSAVAAPANHAGEGGSIPTPALPSNSIE